MMEGGPRRGFVQREVIALIVLSVLAVGAFLTTRAAAIANRRLRLRDAAELYGRGERALAAGQTQSGIEALRRASGIDVDSRQYKLALARALAANGELEPARQALVGLRARVPENPYVNLQLARLETRRGDAAAALNYYHSALYGAWGPDETRARQGVRVELVRYLLQRGDARRAVSELMVLSANLPDDVDAQLEAADLFLAAGDPRQAREHFDRVLDDLPRNERALAGAAQAAFALQDYRSVVRYLRNPPSDQQSAYLRRVAEAVLREDPLQPRVPTAERVRRVEAGIARAVERLAACSAGRPADADLPPLRNELLRVRDTVTVRAVRDNPDLVDDAVALIARAQERSDAICGNPSPADRAWIAIGRLHHVSVS